MEIKLKSQRLQIEDVKIGGVYAKHDNETVFYVSEGVIIDNTTGEVAKKCMLTRIGGASTQIFDSLSDLYVRMVSYSLKPANIRIEEI